MPQFGKPVDLRSFSAALKRTRRELVFVDPLYLALLAGREDLSAANLYQIGPLLGAFAETCLDAGATPVVLHHFRKATQAGKNERASLSDLSFSGVGEYVRQWMLLSRRDPYAPGSGRHALALTVGGSVGHSGEWSLDIDEGPYDLADSVEDGQPRRRWEVTIEQGVAAPATPTGGDRRTSTIARQNEEFVDAVNALTLAGQQPTLRAIRRKRQQRTGSDWSGDTAKAIASRLIEAGELIESTAKVATGNGKLEQSAIYIRAESTVGRDGGTHSVPPSGTAGRDAP